MFNITQNYPSLQSPISEAVCEVMRSCNIKPDGASDIIYCAFMQTLGKAYERAYQDNKVTVDEASTFVAQYLKKIKFVCEYFLTPYRIQNKYTVFFSRLAYALKASDKWTIECNKLINMSIITLTQNDPQYLKIKPVLIDQWREQSHVSETTTEARETREAQIVDMEGQQKESLQDILNNNSTTPPNLLELCLHWNKAKAELKLQTKKELTSSPLIKTFNSIEDLSTRAEAIPRFFDIILGYRLIELSDLTTIIKRTIHGAAHNNKNITKSRTKTKSTITQPTLSAHCKGNSLYKKNRRRTKSKKTNLKLSAPRNGNTLYNKKSRKTEERKSQEVASHVKNKPVACMLAIKRKISPST